MSPVPEMAHFPSSITSLAKSPMGRSISWKMLVPVVQSLDKGHRDVHAESSELKPGPPG